MRILILSILSVILITGIAAYNGIKQSLNQEIPGQHTLTSLPDSQIGQLPEDFVALVRAGDVAAVKDFLRVIDCPNARNKKGETALTVAIEEGHFDLVKILLQNGADANLRSQGDIATQLGGRFRLASYPYAHACSSLHLLFGNDREIGVTPLMIASYEGYPEIVKELIHWGARLEDLCTNGGTALMYAALYYRPQTDTVSENNEGLIKTKPFTDIATVRALLDAGAEVNTLSNTSQNAVMFAAWQEKPDVVQLLIQHSADVNVIDKNGQNALLVAASFQSYEVVQILLKAQAEINAKGNDGTTALMESMLGYKTAVTKALLQQGADVHAVDDFGRTALHFAAKSHSVEKIKLLIEAGANINAKDKWNKPPLLYVGLYDYNNTAETLKGYGAIEDLDTELLLAAQKSDLNKVKEMLYKGANVNATGEFNQTPLFYALSHKPDFNVIKLLIDSGADINAQETAFGRAPLFYAVINDNVESVQELLNRGADVNTKDRFGLTVLTEAKTRSNAAVISLLTAAGARENTEEILFSTERDTN